MDRLRRIKIIQGIVELLRGKNINEINFLFKELGIPFTVFTGGYDPSDDFNFNTEKYLFEQLSEADDSAIDLLHRHLVNEPEEYTESTSWKDGYFRLFLSHSSLDKVFLSDLKFHLERHAIEGFLAHEDIDPSEEWYKEIENRLNSADATVAVLTDNFKASKWTDHEIGFAVCRRQMILPVFFGLNMPYGFMSKYQGLKGSDDPRSLAKAIYDSLKNNSLSKDKITEAIIDAFCSSTSWTDSIFKINLIEDISDWTTPRLRKLEHALNTNGQISGAFKVPPRVKAIIETHSKRP